MDNKYTTNYMTYAITDHEFIKEAYDITEKREITVN